MENITYDPKWNSATNEELIEHILKRYHQVHRQQFSELIELATTVESVHSDHPECPTGLSQHLKAMESELISHMEKEEGILFPIQGLSRLRSTMILPLMNPTILIIVGLPYWIMSL